MNQCEKDLNTAQAALKAEFVAFKEMMDERHALYKERHDSSREAVAAALRAATEQTKAAFDASEKAIVKAEQAQTAYNVAHNDLVRKMDLQNQATMPRNETESRFKAMEEKVALLTGSFTAGTGHTAGAQANREDSRANIGMIIGVIGAMILVGGVFVSIVMFVVKGS